jgi:hypothetical protein
MQLKERVRLGEREKREGEEQKGEERRGRKRGSEGGLLLYIFFL